MLDDEVRLAPFDGIDARTAYSLWRLREAVFVVEQQCAFADLDGRDLEPGARHLWVTDGEAPVAYLRLLDDGDRARIGRVVVAAEWRGRGLAEKLMRRALEVVGEREACLDAQSDLVAWYTRFGFEPTGPAFVEDGIPHVPMRRVRTAGGAAAACSSTR